MATNDNSLSGSKIAKNTLILYFRMFLLMIISLYTSRVVLKVLGVDDFGIYNVVAGVVAMFAILSQSLSTAISRFLTFELGKNNPNKLKRIFSTALSVQIFMALGLIIICEPIAIWFLNTHLQIPVTRLYAANWVLQCSILIFLINLISVPFNAAIIAHERMSAFAYISLIEGSAKLLIAFLITFSSFDKLITYAILMLLVDLLTKGVYVIYCRKKFAECRYRFIYDKSLLKEIGSFAGWNFIGNGVWILNTQGINILTNLFFHVKVNAARGVATQVGNAVQQFVNNFTTALNPQITKSYAMGEYSYMNKLIFKGAKYSYFLMFFFALPICLETEQILNIWLHKVPEYSIVFVRLTFVASLCTVTADTLVRAMFATGRIKKYQIVVGTIGLMNFPLTYLAFKLGCPPWAAYIVYAVIYFILIFVRLFLVKELITLSAGDYIKNVLLNILFVSTVSSIFPFAIRYFMPQSMVRLLIVFVLSFISCAASIYFLGLDKSEKAFFLGKLKKLLHRK